MSIVHELAKKNPKPRVVIIKLKDEIREALNLGYTKKDIWRLLKEQGKLNCSPELFTKYVNRYVLKIDIFSQKKDVKEKRERLSPIEETILRNSITKNSNNEKKSFDFDPMKAKELI